MPAPNSSHQNPDESRGTNDQPRSDSQAGGSATNESTIPASASARISARVDDTQTSPSPEVPLAESVEMPVQLGGYRIIKLLGEGGMGAVYAAEDLALRRPVALKTMKHELASNESARSRFTREARAAAAVESDHIVRIYFVGEDLGIPFIAMEFLRGKPLDVWMRNRLPVAVQHVVKIGYETALGLAAAHKRGLIHRDIKPANIWLEAPQGRVKILDFGLARSAEGDVQLTGTGVVVGTPAYMAPEQARGQAVDHRSDLFSLGCVLYQLTTGQRPFTGSTTLAILSSLAMEVPVPPCEKNPAVPMSLSRLIERLIAKNPQDRPQSANEVVEELKRIVKGEPAAAASAALPQSAVLVKGQGASAMAPSGEAETNWEDIAVSGATAEGPALETSQSRKPVKKSSSPWPIYAASGGLLLLALCVAIGLWSSMKPAKTAKVDEPEKAPAQTPPRRSTPTPTPNPQNTPTRPFPKRVLPPNIIPAMIPVKAENPLTLDHLDPRDIPAEERLYTLPREVVGVIGSHRRRIWGWTDPGLLLSADDKRVIAAGKLLIDLESLKETVLPRECLAFLPDSRHVLTADGIWDILEPNKEPVRLPFAHANVRFLTNRIMLGWTDNTAVLSLVDEKEPRIIDKFRAARGAFPSSDGKMLAVMPESADSPIDLYDVTEKGVTKRGSLSGPEGKGRVTSFSKNRLAMAGADNIHHIWDVSDKEPKLLATIPTPATYVQLLDSSPRILTLVATALTVWEYEGEKPKIIATANTAFPYENFHWMAATSDGRTIVTGHLNGAVRIWSFEKDIFRERDPLTQQPSANSVVSADGRSLLSRPESGTGKAELRNLSVRTLDRLATPDDFIGIPSPPSPDGKFLTMIGGGAGLGISFWQFGPEKMIERSVRFGNDCSIGWSPNGKWLASAEGDLVLWDVSKTVPKEHLRVPALNARSVRFTGTGQHLMVYGDSPPTLMSFAITDKQLIEQDRTDWLNHSWTISPSGKTIVRNYKTLDFFDIIDGNFAAVPRIAVAPCTNSIPEFSPDGKNLVISRGNAVQLLDNDGIVTRMVTFPGNILNVCYHPDGRHLFVTGGNNVTYIVRLSAAPSN